MPMPGSPGATGLSVPPGALPPGAAADPALVGQYPTPEALAQAQAQSQAGSPSFMNDCVRKYGALSLRMVGASQLFGHMESRIAQQNGIKMVEMNWTGQQVVAQSAAPPSRWARFKSFFTGQAPAASSKMVTERLVLPAGVQNVFNTSEQLNYANRMNLAREAYSVSGTRGAFRAFMTRPESMGTGWRGHLRGSWNNFLYNNMGLKSYYQPTGPIATTSGGQVIVKGGIQSIAGKLLPIMFGYSMISAFTDGYCADSRQGGVMAGLWGGTTSLASEFVKTFVSYKVADMALYAARFALPRVLPFLVPGGLPLTLLSLGFMALAGVAAHWGVGKAITGIKDSILGLFGFGKKSEAPAGMPCAPCGR
jgi:hypothetical protein